MKILSKSIALLICISNFLSQLKSQSAEFFYPIQQDVRIGDYFNFIDTTIIEIEKTIYYKLTEHLLARANPYLINRLKSTDYYEMKNRTGAKVYNQANLLVFRAGDSLRIPSSEEAAQIFALQQTTQLDINLPEYRLRIIENGDTLFTFPIRIGQNRNRLLEAVGREVDLRTRCGRGQVAVLHRDLVHVDPVTADTFTHTRRDDGFTTRMPQIPWIEPRIDGLLRGQWIHPTTNLKTLEKPYSNGCIGVRESDAWITYFFAPVGTSVVIRYDLEIPDGQGGVRVLEDVYFREPEWFLPMQPAAAADQDGWTDDTD